MMFFKRKKVKSRKEIADEEYEKELMEKRDEVFSRLKQFEEEKRKEFMQSHMSTDYVDDYGFDNDYKTYHIIKNKSKLSLAYWIMAFKESRSPDKNILANIELSNGFFKTFIVKEENQGFIFENKKFVFDNVSKYYNVDFQMWCYDYHIDYSIPIKRKININKAGFKHEEIVLPLKRGIPINEIRNALEHSGICEVEYASHPSALHKFVNSNVIKMILAGAELDAVFKFVKLMLILIFIGVLVVVFFMLKNAGIIGKFTGG